MKLVGPKSALNSRWFVLLTVLRRWSRCWSYSLLLCYLFYEAICFKSCLVLFCSCVFQSFNIAITSLVEKKANISAFCTFVRFALVWFCLFSLTFGVWEGLWLLIVSLPGLFFLPFLLTISSLQTKTDTCANSLDQNETACNEPSHQDLDCSHFYLILD